MVEDGPFGWSPAISNRADAVDVDLKSGFVLEVDVDEEFDQVLQPLVLVIWFVTYDNQALRIGVIGSRLRSTVLLLCSRQTPACPL